MRKLVLPVKRIVKLYLEGWTIVQLAKRYKVSYTPIRARLDEADVLRRGPRIKAEKTEFAFLTKFLTTEQLAERYGVTEQAIRRKIKRQRIKKARVPRNERVNEYTPAAIRYLREVEKLKIREIAEKCGLSMRTVCYLQKIDISNIREKLIYKGE